MWHGSLWTLVTLCLAGCLGSPTVPADRTPVTGVRTIVPETASSQRPGSGLPTAWQPQMQPGRTWRFVVLHHTASSGGSVESIHQEHLKRTTDGQSWLGIGYHFVIGNGRGMVDGAVEPTFRWKQQLQGAHAGVKQYNQQGIGVVLVGDFSKTRPTAAQLTAVRRLVTALRTEYMMPANRIVGHRDIKATACPGKNFSLSLLRKQTGSQ